METTSDTSSVSAIRLSNESDVPDSGERVLAVLAQWADRPLSLQHLEPGESFSFVPGLEGPRVSWRAGRPHLVVPAGLEGRVQGAGADYAVPGGSALTLGDGQRLTLRGGGVTWHAALRPRAAGAPAVEPAGDDVRFFKIVAFALLVFFAGAAAMVVTPDFSGLETDIWGSVADGLDGRYLSVAAASPRKADPIAAFREEGLEGHVKEEAKQVPVGAASKAPPAELKGESREAREQKVKLAMAGLFGSSLDQLVGASSLGGSIDQALNALGTGNRSTANVDGLGGLGSRGEGPGGGGGGIGGLGIASAGTLGATCDETGCRAGLIGLKGRAGPHVICRLPIDEARVSGIDRDLVAKVVRRHQSEIRFCYESELSKSPELAGKVTMRWVIAPDGAVAAAEVSESTLGSAAVERCMADRIRRWQFPVPENAGETIVNFPWIFSVAAADAD